MHASFQQVVKQNRYDGVPNYDFINVSNVNSYPSCRELQNSEN